MYKVRVGAHVWRPHIDQVQEMSTPIQSQTPAELPVNAKQLPEQEETTTESDETRLEREERTTITS